MPIVQPKQRHRNSQRRSIDIPIFYAFDRSPFFPRKSMRHAAVELGCANAVTNPGFDHGINTASRWLAISPQACDLLAGDYTCFCR